MSRRLSAVAVVLALLALASPVWAHVGAPTMTPRESSVLADYGSAAVSATRAVNPGPWPLAAGAAVVLALALRRRRVLMLALVLLLAGVAFEAGLHSVHHLTEADAAKCAVTAVSSHTGGVVVVVFTVERPADVVTHAPPLQAATLAPSYLFAPDRGRAPPAA